MTSFQKLCGNDRAMSSGNEVENRFPKICQSVSSTASDSARRNHLLASTLRRRPEDCFVAAVAEPATASIPLTSAPSRADGSCHLQRLDVVDLGPEKLPDVGPDLG